MKIAINGGVKEIKYKMPPRFAFGSNEQKEVKKMINYYRQRGQDPKFSGMWEKKFCSEINCCRFCFKGFWLVCH